MAGLDSLCVLRGKSHRPLVYDHPMTLFSIFHHMCTPHIHPHVYCIMTQFTLYWRLQNSSGESFNQVQSHFLLLHIVRVMIFQWNQWLKRWHSHQRLRYCLSRYHTIINSNNLQTSISISASPFQQNWCTVMPSQEPKQFGWLNTGSYLQFAANMELSIWKLPELRLI